MIAINLLPVEFRVKKKNLQKTKYYLYAILGGGIFVLLTLGLYADYWGSSRALKVLDKKWKTLEPKQKALAELQKEVDGPIRQERLFMEQFVTTQRPLTRLLEWVSSFLPETAWIEELSLQRNQGQVNYLIKGLAIPSKEKTSIEQIEKYVGDLKANIADSKIILKTNRVMSGQVEVMQFVLNFSWSEVTETPEPEKPAAKAKPERGKKK